MTCNNAIKWLFFGAKRDSFGHANENAAGIKAGGVMVLALYGLEKRYL